MKKTATETLEKAPDNANLTTPAQIYQIPSITDKDGRVIIPVQPCLLIDPASDPVQMLTGKVPNRFISQAAITATVAAFWTPAAGRRFRLLGFDITLAAGTTAAAACTVTVQDGAVVLFSYQLNGAAMAAPAAPVMVAQVALPGNGYLSLAAGNVVQVALSSALAVGGISVNMWGCDE